MKSIFSVLGALCFLFLGAAARADSKACSVDGNCGNANYPYQVIDANGQNVTGRCEASLGDAMNVFYGLEETGQCAKGTPQTCVIDGNCGNADFPYEVSFANGGNVTNRCVATFLEALHNFQALETTGQCAAGTAQACSINGECGNANYPYQVVYTANGTNVTNRCVDTFDNALDMFRGLQQSGQCAANTTPTK